MRDVTFCCTADCPSTECKVSVKNNRFEPGELISIADFGNGGECRFYDGWTLWKWEGADAEDSR